MNIFILIFCDQIKQGLLIIKLKNQVAGLDNNES